jgi:hypothetical protein
VGYLPRLPDSIDVARQRYQAGADWVEIVVADKAFDRRHGRCDWYVLPESRDGAAGSITLGVRPVLYFVDATDA